MFEFNADQNSTTKISLMEVNDEIDRLTDDPSPLTDMLLQALLVRKMRLLRKLGYIPVPRRDRFGRITSVGTP
jgi:hypothetical protein